MKNVPIKTTIESLRHALARFDQDKIDISPAKGSWSAGQVGEHMVKGLSGMTALVDGHTEKATRPFDEKAAQIEAVFLDFNTKMQSPDFVKPQHTKHDKADLLAKLSNIETELAGLAAHADLSLLLLDFELPGSGAMTLYEWLTFLNAHAIRHTRQLDNIYTALYQ